MIRKIWKWLVGDKWVVVRTVWPYPNGYGTMNEYRNMLADAGLTKEHAQSICDEMNKQKNDAE